MNDRRLDAETSLPHPPMPVAIGGMAAIWLLTLIYDILTGGWNSPPSGYGIWRLALPLFGCIILGLSGDNLLARGLGIRPLVFVGEASYCLYLLHFNFWNLIHDSHVLEKIGLAPAP